MFGLAIVLGFIVVAYFVTPLDTSKAYEQPQEEKEKTIHLTNIPNTEQITDEELKEQWLSNFNQLKKSNNSNDDTD